MRRGVAALVAGAALACADDPVPSPDGASDAGGSLGVPSGWIPMLAADPGRFESAMAAGQRPRWIAAHEGRWVAPSDDAHTEEPGFVAAQAAVEDLLSALESELLARLVQTWDERGRLVPTDPVVAVAWLSALDAGVPGARAPSEDLAGVRALEEVPGHPAAGEPVRACVNAHLHARAAGTFAASDACAALSGTSLPDPLARRTRSAALRQRAVATDPVAAAAFTGRWSTEAAPCPVAEGLDGWHAEALAVDSRAAALQAAAGPGQSLVDELQLLAAHRARRLAACAAEAVLHGGVAPGVVLPRVEALVDVGAGERLRPTNPPILFAALALVRLHAGRSRATLDALHAMRETWVDMPPLIELAGDHHVATGLGRDGDSKEH